MKSSVVYYRKDGAQMENYGEASASVLSSNDNVNDAMKYFIIIASVGLIAVCIYLVYSISTHTNAIIASPQSPDSQQVLGALATPVPPSQSYNNNPNYVKVPLTFGVGSISAPSGGVSGIGGAAGAAATIANTLAGAANNAGGSATTAAAPATTAAGTANTLANAVNAANNAAATANTLAGAAAAAAPVIASTAAGTATGAATGAAATAAPIATGAAGTAAGAATGAVGTAAPIVTGAAGTATGAVGTAAPIVTGAAGAATGAAAGGATGTAGTATGGVTGTGTGAGATTTPTVVTPPTMPTATYSPKKGFVAGTDDPTAGLKITNLNGQWYYTWGATPPKTVGQALAIKFTPMIWNIAKISTAGTVAGAAAVVNSLTTLNTATTDNILLTYNEPDGTNASAQGNMKVGDAVSFWPTILAARIGTNIVPPLLGSPVMYGSVLIPSTDAPGIGKNVNNLPQPPYGASGTTTATGIQQIDISNTSTPNLVSLNPAIWLDNFLIQVSQSIPKAVGAPALRRFPDFICIHWYGPPNITSFTNYIQNVYAKYHLPIWVTEYSSADWNATCCPTVHSTIAGIDWSYPTKANIATNSTAQFLQATTNWMNSQPYVQRYSWKERYLLVPNTYSTIPSVIPQSDVAGCPTTGCPTDSSSSMIGPTNPDFMGQSALFQSYVHFPTSVPPLTPLGTLYSAI